MEKEEDKKTALWKKILLRSAVAVSAIILLLTILLIGIAPERQVGNAASMEENRCVMSVVSKLSNSLFTKENKIAVQSTVNLTPAEVNAILSTAIRAYQLRHSGSRDAILFGELKDGRIQLYASQPFLGKLAVNGRGSVIPSVSDKKLKLEFSGLRAGWLPLPGVLADKIAEKFLAKVEVMPEYQGVMEVISELKINSENNLELTFIPGKISVLLTLLLQR